MKDNIPLLRVENLSKSFGELKAVDRVNFEMAAGGIVSIIGPNGAGKSTLVNILTGFIIPDTGHILFKGNKIEKKSIQYRVRKGLNRSFQINSLFNDRTVKENILLALLYWDLPLKSILRNRLDAQLESKVMDILKSINMVDKMNKEVDKLSHGEQRLIEITLATAKTPELLFLDEPTSGLSPSERTLIIDKIKSIAEGGTTVVLIEHNMDVVFSLAKRIIVLNRGSVIADDKPESIRENKEVKKIYLGEDLTIAED
jgi:branched-chain amino acid transport system ATP-binding protein